jgi:hypothetical protein
MAGLLCSTGHDAKMINGAVKLFAGTNKVLYCLSCLLDFRVYVKFCLECINVFMSLNNVQSTSRLNMDRILAANPAFSY